MQTTIETRSLPEQIRDALIAQISSGELQPGDRLIETKIAQAMQTSQAPVREALRELEALSLIETRRNRGSVVRAMTAEDLWDLYAVRAELEGLAAAIVAERFPETGDMLLSLCADMDDAVSQNDTARFIELNDTFHRTIVETAGNKVLSETWGKLQIRARTAANVARNARPLKTANKEHRDIANAIQSGAPGRARRRIAGHITSVVGLS